jgi:hypothetical protein
MADRLRVYDPTKAPPADGLHYPLSIATIIEVPANQGLPAGTTTGWPTKRAEYQRPSDGIVCYEAPTRPCSSYWPRSVTGCSGDI